MIQFATLNRDCIITVDADDEQEAWGALEERIRYLSEEQGVLLPDPDWWVFEGDV